MAPRRVAGVPARRLGALVLCRGRAEEREDVHEPFLRKCDGGSSQVEGKVYCSVPGVRVLVTNTGTWYLIHDLK